MAFIKEITIYGKDDGTRVYINECYHRGRKTRIFAIRRDDDTAFGSILGTIKFSGRWRQYVFYPEINTMWSYSCLNKISEFLEMINQRWRDSLTKHNGN